MKQTVLAMDQANHTLFLGNEIGTTQTLEVSPHSSLQEAAATFQQPHPATHREVRVMEPQPIDTTYPPTWHILRLRHYRSGSVDVWCAFDSVTGRWYVQRP